MSKLKKNKYLQEPQAVLDLHGLTLDEADNAVNDFVDEAMRKNYRLVRIITGKGLGSTGGPVLRPWLEDYLVFGGFDWRQAKISEGGEGAFDIKL
ncbi:MAG: Smr/MutS family protein [Candidatus Falkowbacteria bacterium]